MIDLSSTEICCCPQPDVYILRLASLRVLICADCKKRLRAGETPAEKPPILPTRLLGASFEVCLVALILALLMVRVTW